MKKLQVTSYKLRVIKVAFCLLLSAFCFLPVGLLAQKAKPPKSNHRKPEVPLTENKKVFTSVSFGPTVDWFSPTTNEFDLQRNKSKGGFIAGINVEVGVVPQRYLYFSTGLLCRFLQGDLAFQHRYTISIVNTTSPIAIPTVRTYQTFYLTLPTGIKFRTAPTKNCVFTGQLGLYHNFRVGGKTFDNFTLSKIDTDPEYFITTSKVKNTDAALFAESGYLGIGFEYEFAPKIRAFANVNYSCQFGYFSAKATNNVTNKQFKSIVHSLHIVFGVMF
jgi:hypothetical protein